MYGIYDPFGVRLINRLRLGFSHLREHKFKHNSDDTLNPLCSCTLETENTEYFFLRCQNNLSTRTTLMSQLNNINYLNSTDFIRVIRYGDKNFDNVSNFKIITATIKLVKTTKNFREALFRTTDTTQNAVISPNFLVWDFCGKTQFPHSFG